MAIDLIGKWLNQQQTYFMNVSLSHVEKLADAFRLVDSELSSYERLSLAIQLQRNMLLGEAFVISSQQGVPPALEKIAMEMVDLNSILGESRDSIHQAANSIDEINQKQP